MALKGTKHLRISKDQTWDNRKEWKITDINIGNKLHTIQEEGSIVNRTNIPIINIFEFQPTFYRNIQQYIKKVKRQYKRSLEHFQNMYNNIVKNQKKIAEAITNTTTANLGSTVDKLGESFQVNYDEYNKDIFIEPIKDVKGVFGGKYIRTYQIPYNNDMFIDVNGKSGWDTLAASGINLGDNVLNTIFKSVASLVETPSYPTWKSESSEKGFYAFSTKFNLINNNIDTLVKNFTFLSQLFQGTMWMQVDSLKIPPNIYSIEIPGQLFIQYCALSINVKSVGNKRRINNTEAMKRKFDVTGYKVFKESYEDIYFPDAWEVDLTFKSLLPTSFNTFMNYYQNGMGDGEPFKQTIAAGDAIENGLDVLEGGVLNNDDVDRTPMGFGNMGGGMYNA